MQKRISVSSTIQELNETVTILEKHLPAIISQPPIWRHRIPLDAQLTYLKEIASARRSLWQAILKEHPETTGFAISVNSVAITYEEPEESGLTSRISVD
jgi:hypothetical protein